MSPPAWTASVLGRARSPMAWFQLVAGLWLFAAGVVLGLRSRLGVGPWDVLHDGIRHVTPLSFGVATILVGVVLLVAGALAGVRPGPGTLVNMVLIGIFSDAMLATGIGADLGARGLPMRLAAVVVGVLLVALGSALYIGAGLGSGPRDSLMLAIAARTGLRVGVVRAIIETSVLIIGVLLGGAAGIGTILFAFGIGPAVEVAFRLLRVEVPSKKTAPRVQPFETCSPPGRSSESRRGAGVRGPQPLGGAGDPTVRRRAPDVAGHGRGGRRRHGHDQHQGDRLQGPQPAQRPQRGAVRVLGQVLRALAPGRGCGPDRLPAPGHGAAGRLLPPHQRRAPGLGRLPPRHGGAAARAHPDPVREGGPEPLRLAPGRPTEVPDVHRKRRRGWPTRSTWDCSFASRRCLARRRQSRASSGAACRSSSRSQPRSPGTRSGSARRPSGSSTRSPTRTAARRTCPVRWPPRSWRTSASCSASPLPSRSTSWRPSCRGSVDGRFPSEPEVACTQPPRRSSSVQRVSRTWTRSSSSSSRWPPRAAGSVPSRRWTATAAAGGWPRRSTRSARSCWSPRPAAASSASWAWTWPATAWPTSACWSPRAGAAAAWAARCCGPASSGRAGPAPTRSRSRSGRTTRRPWRSTRSSVSSARACCAATTAAATASCGTPSSWACLGEADLGDQLGAHPVDAAPRQPVVLERRLGACQPVEPRPQVPQHGLAVAGADLAGVAQRTAVVVADQQRPQPHPRAGRIGPAADHELLLVDALELQPVLRAGVLVRRVGARGDQALPAPAAGVPVQRLALGVAVRQEAKWVPVGQRVAQQRLPVAELERGGVVALEMEDVEEVVEHRDAAAQRAGGVAELDAALEALEAGARPLERDDLPVDDEVVAALRFERADQLGVGLVQRLAGPRQQPQPASVAEGQAALAVQFALVDPSGVGEALVGQHGQHRRCPFRLLLRPQQFPGPRRESVQRAGHAAPSAPVLVGGAPCGFPQTARLTREAELASWEGRAGVLGERPAGSTSRRPRLIAPRARSRHRGRPGPPPGAPSTGPPWWPRTNRAARARRLPPGSRWRRAAPRPPAPARCR